MFKKTLILGMVLGFAGLCFAKETKTEAEIKGRFTANTISKICTCEKFIGNIESKEEICKKIPQLIKQLNCSHPFHRERAIILLGRSGNPQVVKPLADVVLDNNRDCGDRQGAIESLGRLGTRYQKGEIPSLKKNFEEIIIPTLRNVLKSEDRGIRFNAAINLYELSETSSIVLSALENLAKEGYTGVLHCFSKITSEGKIIYDKNAKAFYIKALNYKDDEVRIAAAFHLVKMGEEKIAYPVVIDILENSKEEWSRYSAIDILKEIGDKKSKMAIESVLKDKENLVRDYAKKALAEMEEDK